MPIALEQADVLRSSRSDLVERAAEGGILEWLKPAVRQLRFERVAEEGVIPEQASGRFRIVVRSPVTGVLLEIRIDRVRKIFCGSENVFIQLGQVLIRVEVVIIATAAARAFLRLLFFLLLVFGLVVFVLAVVTAVKTVTAGIVKPTFVVAAPVTRITLP